ncbi:MAG: xanthine dehydrogenase family protein molybdopterin-binding subunit [Candidatus Latescibacteria bacterium]|nr:xanthine dehydrogenase family protein molybdopterin-binding subunit [Candidatus Latescibacterota bacterium]
MKHIGQHIPRLDGVAKVTGKAKYTYDINLPGLLYGKILRSAHPRARVVKIDASKAMARPGVKAVLLPDDVKGLFNKECRYAGQEVAAVAATSPDIAEDALALIDVQYEKLPFVVDVDDAMKPDAAQVYGDRKNVSDPRVREQGDVAAGFATADVVVEATYRCQVQTHVALETHGTVARWDGDKLTVWASTQGVFSVRDELAKYFNLPATQVRVITEYMGGGFGAKFGARPEGIIAALLAKKAGAPVKLMLSRKEEHLTTGNRPSSIQQVKIGAKKDGTLVAYQRSNYGTGGVAGGAGIPAGPYIYAVPNFRVEQRDVSTNAGAQAAQRAPGHPQASFGMESVMDELAEKLGIDPLELRKKNDPNKTRQKEYDIAAQKIGWERRNKTPGAGSGTKKRGMGIGSCTWGGGGSGTKAQVTINNDGSVEVKCGTQDIGTGTKTIIAIITAEEFGLSPQDIQVRIGDTDFPPSGGSGGSTTAASVSPAIKSTTMLAKQKLFEVVAPKLGAQPADLVARDGKVFVKSDPSKSVAWKQATAQLADGPITIQGEWVAGYSDTGVAGTQFVEVEVDTETGHVQMLKVVAVHDCGLVIDRLTAESQVNGGVLMGVGYALYEDRILDSPTGHMVNANLEDYKVVGAMEVPEIEAIFYDEPHRGVIGLGEPPVIPTAGAIANAIYNACGARVRELPITPDKVLTALAQTQRKEG